MLVFQSSHNKVPQAEWLTIKKLLSHSSGGWKSEMGLLAGLVPSEAVKENLSPTS